jgi:uroporphyrinogen-III synthase
MTEGPLTGRRVVVTRARAQASGLVKRLEGLGATVVELPVIAVEPPTDGGAALTRAGEAVLGGEFEWVVFTSSNAVGPFLRSLGSGSPPGTVKWAAVGSGTARVLAQGGIAADLIPEVPIAESLVAGFPSPPDRGGDGGGRVLFPRAEQVRPTLAAGLRGLGWTVEEVIAYRTVAGRPDEKAIADADHADAVAFTSSSTVDRAIGLLGLDGLPPVAVTIGPITSASARAAGVTVVEEASPHTLEGLVDAVVRAIGPEREHFGAADRRRQQSGHQQQ